MTGHLAVEGKGQAEAADLVQTYGLVSTSGAVLALRCYEGLTQGCLNSLGESRTLAAAERRGFVAINSGCSPRMDLLQILISL